MMKVVKEEKNRAGGIWDSFKWGLALLLLTLGFVANYDYIAVPLSLRIVAWVVLLCIVLLVAGQTVKGRLVWKFFQGAREELRKVVWPTRHDTVRTTFIVLVLVILFAVVMWLADSVLMWAVTWLTGQ